MATNKCSVQYNGGLLPDIMYDHTYGKSMDQSGKVAHPVRGQLNRENELFPVRVRAREFGLARRFRQSRPASACLSDSSGSR